MGLCNAHPQLVAGSACPGYHLSRGLDTAQAPTSSCCSAGGKRAKKSGALAAASMAPAPNPSTGTAGALLEVYYVATAVAVILLLRRLFTARKNLPPGPPGLPIIGHLHLLGTHPHKDFAKISEKYGPLVSLRLGQRQFIIASSPETAKEFLQNQDANFSARPPMAQGNIMLYGRQDIAWQSNTPAWRHLRKIFVVELTGPQRLKASQHVRQEEVACMLRAIARDGAAVRMKAQLGMAASNIISRMVLNKRYVGVAQDHTTVDPEESEEFREMIEEHFSLAGAFNLGDFIPAIKPLDLQGLERRMKKVSKRADAFVTKIIGEHRERRKGGGGAAAAAEEKDMVDVLLDHMETKEEHPISEENVKSIIMDAFLAGTDTMIVTTEWAMAEVLRNPSILAKAHGELDRVVGRERMVLESDLPELEYLQTIVKETLRLHPPAPLLIPHEAVAACQAFGYDIPAKTRLFVNVWAIARHPSVWDDPLRFDPDRFLSAKLAAVDVRGQDFELLPFGSGRRSCPGILMGYLVVQFVLANLLHAFHWSLPDGLDPADLDMSDSFGLTCPRAVPLLAVAKPRLARSLYE